MTRRISWTNALRSQLIRLKQAGLTHHEAAARMGLTFCQICWGWKLCRENAPARKAVKVDAAFIRKVSTLRNRGLYRHEIAGKLGVPLSRIDAAISLGRERGMDMEVNARIYSERQQKHGMRSRTLV
ncbi:hypothetical protein [Bombella mellum]|uniref:DNA-binding protein n=1 Tax=Bombella mellum TaxID=2039288 RepID=A0ABR5ZRR3_9PROT|nr:hypothetical protein [Bombella mellum]MBA5726930.1 hypothetical protein [Bombella mellum]